MNMEIMEGIPLVNEDCSQKFIEITDFSRCTEHPFAYVLAQVKCASSRGEEYSIKVPSGTIPLNVLLLYVSRYNVEMSSQEEGEFTVFRFSQKKER